MKQHDENEYWKYDNEYKRMLIPVYFVDGQIRGSEHGTAQYLIDNYGMSITEAYKYVHEIGSHH